MSKTYTLAATVTCKRGSARSSTLSNATTAYTSNTIIGSTGASTHYSCIFAFNSTTMTSLRTKTVESITLDIRASTAASGPFHPYYGPKKATGTSSAEISSSYTINILSGTTHRLIDVTDIGLPTTNAFCMGSQANISGETYATMRGITADLVVVTNETDYVLTYNANGGSGAPSSQTGTGVGSYKFTVSSTAPTRSGYVFKGWAKTSTATSAAYQPGGTITVTANTTLYAVWYKTLNLSYNANGGSGAPASESQTVYSSASFVVSSVIPTPPADYRFVCWNTDASGSGTDYISGSTITITANTTLYAKYESAPTPSTDDFHYKHGSRVYGGQVWVKLGGQMHHAEVWVKRDGQIYKGE